MRIRRTALHIRCLRSTVLPSLIRAAFACAPFVVPTAHGQISTPVAKAQDELSEPLFATPTRLDRAGRVVVAVEVNGQGPFRFIVDTGANRSAVSEGLAERLHLPDAGSANIGVHGVTGYAELRAVEIEQLRVGSVELARLRLPVLPHSVLADADGILGIEGLQETRIEIDFERDSVVIRRSGGQRAPRGYLTVPARLEKGGLLVVRGRVGTIRAQVIIDTGAERSIGNRQLAEALERKMSDIERSESIVVGATPGSVTAVAHLSPPISIGGAKLHNLIVTFGDLHVFRVWSLEDEPAIVVGMDVLGTLDQLVVDYARREFHLKPRGDRQPSVDLCSRTGCGSRLPGRGP